MTSQTLRAAALSAALLLAPFPASFANAADEPAKPETKDVKPKEEKPADAPKAGEAPARPQRGGGAGGGGRMDPAAMIERIDSALKELDLSQEQKTKANELIAKVKKTVAGEDGGRLQAAMQAVTELRDGLKELLNDEQTKALAEKLPLLSRLGAAGGPGGGPGGGPNGRPGGPGAPGAPGGRPGAPGGAGGGGARPQALQRAVQAALEKVDLPADVKAKVKTLSEEMDKKAQTIIEEGKGDRAAIGEKLRPLMEERQKKMAEVLSPEQLTRFREAVQEQLEKMRGDGGGPGAGAGARRPRGEAPATPDKKPEEKKTEEKKSEEKSEKDAK
jgi:Spy/CpxP family protein refolding chaperone